MQLLICPTSQAKSAHAPHAQIVRRASLPQARDVAENQNRGHDLPRPASARGALRIVTNARRDAMDADRVARRATCDADSKVVWSWRPWAGAKPCGMTRKTTVTKRSWTPGRARTSLLTPSRREGRARPVEPVVTCSCALSFRTRGCGCNWRPAFPAPSVAEGR
jgi:hypothetical protein